METEPSALRAIFSRTFIAISLINMVGMIGYYAIFVVCTRYLMDGFQASAATAGLATGIVVIGCLVGRFFTGSVIRDVGYRRVLLIGVFFFFLVFFVSRARSNPFAAHAQCCSVVFVARGRLRF